MHAEYCTHKPNAGTGVTSFGITRGAPEPGAESGCVGGASQRAKAALSEAARQKDAHGGHVDLSHCTAGARRLRCVRKRDIHVWSLGAKKLSKMVAPGLLMSIAARWSGNAQSNPPPLSSFFPSSQGSSRQGNASKSMRALAFFPYFYFPRVVVAGRLNAEGRSLDLMKQ